MERMLELDQQVLYRILDVRGEAEFEAGHVPGALNIAHTRLLARAEEMTKDGRWRCTAGAGPEQPQPVPCCSGWDVRSPVSTENSPGSVLEPRTQNLEPRT